MKKYDIFLSYRRKGGWETAKHLYDLMTRDGYSVSFDIDTLRDGLFDEELLKRIDECTDFIVFLDKNVFDRTIDNSCPRENDWLRIELAYAIKKDKNIIPIMLAGFNEFPENLPDDISKIKRYNGPKFDNYYFDNFYERLLTMFVHSVPEQTEDTNEGCLKILTDTECRVYIDYEDKGISHPHQIMRIPLCAGSYCLRFESISDKNNYIEDSDFTISANTEKLYKVNLKKDTDETISVSSSAEKPSTSSVNSFKPEFTSEEMYNNGEKYYNAKDYEHAVDWYLKAAEKGHTDAMNDLGNCYKGNKGVEKDYKQAAEWYQRAAEKGHAGAMNNLGNCYYNGDGVDRDYKEAAEWYQKAAEKGNAGAMFNIGYCYYNGKGVEQDYKQAAEWFHKAAGKGNIHAMSHLGKCYENGKGVDKNKRIGKKLYEAEMVAKRGDTMRAIKMYKEALEVKPRSFLGFKF